MNTDQRDLLDVLKSELAFLEKGGYGRSPREPQRPQLIFEDSPTCMNYDTKEHPDPCSECILMQLVPPESRGAEIPCRHIPFNAEGETLESLYRYAGQYETEQIYGKWLRATIARLEDEREEHREIPASPAATGVVGSKGEPLFHKLNPKCANPACPKPFHWLAGGKFFRFRPDSPFPDANFQSPHRLMSGHDVKHYWLCERCSQVFSLEYDASQGAVVKLIRPELPAGRSPKQMTAA